MLIIAKVFATILSILVISRSIIDFRAKKESLQMTVFWITIWSGIIAVSYWPTLIDKFIELTGGEKTGLGTVFGMAIIFLLFINYRVYVKANRVEKMVQKMTRKVALQNVEKPKGEKSNFLP